MKKRAILIVSVLLAFCLLFSGCGIDGSNPQGTGPSQITSSTSSPDSFENNESSNISTPSDTNDSTNQTQSDSKPVSLDSIPAYSGKAYVNIDNGNPGFSNSDLKTKSYEYYSPLDSLGRCGVVHACVGQDIMPTEDRGSIGTPEISTICLDVGILDVVIAIHRNDEKRCGFEATSLFFYFTMT